MIYQSTPLLRYLRLIPTFMWGRFFMTYISCSSGAHFLPRQSLLLISPLTLSNHLLSCLPRFLLACPFISITLFPTRCSSHHMPISLNTRFLELCAIPSTFVVPPRNFFSCAIISLHLRFEYYSRPSSPSTTFAF